MGYFQCRSPPRRAMTSDGGEKAFDPVLFDVTRISAEEIAEQITKDDFQVFRFIQPDEVISFIFYWFAWFIVNNCEQKETLQ